MNPRLLVATRLFYLGVAIVVGLPIVARAVDIEAFEFNDANGTLLANAANSVNAANKWIEDPGMAPSDIRGGVYNIVKGTLVLESNYLQVGNIASGTRYLVVRMSKWDFENFDSARLEEFRLAFLNDDTGTSGSTISAQMNIRRNAAGNVEIAGDALGTGSTNLPAPAAVATVQSAPFTAVLEINKTSNTYKVFYKDNTNPTQVLGMGSIAPTRSGNSIRMSVNNDFSAFNTNYPADPAVEVVAVDRIALTDTNPFTDLITLEIDRVFGTMTLRNTSGVGLTGLESYSITSTVGAFDPTKWKTITGNYDSGGNGTVDNAPWAVTTSSKTQLAEAFQSGDGGGLTNNQSVVLNLPAGNTWLKSPFEDVHMTLNFAGGVARTVNVNFIGNGGIKWTSGDLNFDNAMTVADWLVFIANSETNLSGLSRAEAYQRGDLNDDGLNNITDFAAFKSAYDVANGAGAFDGMLSTVPEPGSFVLLAFGVFAIAMVARRGSRPEFAYAPCRQPQIHIRPQTRGFSMSRNSFPVLLPLLTAVVLLGAASNASAVIIEDFPFNDVTSTPLDAAENVAHVGNNFFVNTVSWDPSSTLNGSYRITKTTNTLSAAYIDIANVSTGKVWMVAELAGWNFTATPSSTTEQVRFAFLDNDPPAVGSSTITAQMDIRRSAATPTTALSLTGIGALGTGATDISSTFTLPLVRSTPFTMVLELDKTLDKYSVYYKDDTAAYALLGTAELGTSGLNPGDRDGNSIRFGAQGQYNDTGEFFDVNRIYFTDVSPIGAVEPVALTVEARSNGELVIKNATSSAISFDSYRISSPTNALNFAGWNSLSDQNVSAVDGPDPGLTLGDGTGETWDEAGGSNDSVLAESFLLGNSTLAPNDSLSLGSGFDLGGAHDLTFQYHDFVANATITGAVTYPTVASVQGDYNNNGIVDAADYILWRKGGPLQNDPTPGVSAADYTFWRSRFGSNTGSGAGDGLSGAPIPEPNACQLLCVALLGMSAVRRPLLRSSRLGS